MPLGAFQKDTPPPEMAALVGWDRVTEVPETAATIVPFDMPVPPTGSPTAMVPKVGAVIVKAVEPEEAVPFVAVIKFGSFA